MRTHYCGELNSSHIGQEVALCGWAHRHRDHGGVIFIDLRDREGIVQVVCDPQHPESFEVGEKVRSEFVLRIEGLVRRRPEGTENPHLPTGEIEVLAKRAEILNASLPPPFAIEDQDDPSEAVRLKFRYLDLRRPKMLKRMRLRARIAHNLRRFLETHGFIEVETPYLTRSTPEGARDYLVPSRLHPGHFYALPQSPQLFKQILMIGGLDRYYQIARCFRDEDLRADRQPEFTQLDIEMSFVHEEDVMGIMESMMRELFRETLGDELEDPFPRLSYQEALRRFGTDRPDLSNPLELAEVSDLMEGVDFKVFAAPAADPEGRVAALRLPGGASLTRKQIDDYTRFVGHYGAKGLAYIKVNPGGLQSPILKFLPEGAVQSVLEKTGAKSGDIVFFGADKAAVVNDALAALRQKLAADLDLHRPGWYPVWIVDFPMFEWSEEQRRWVSLHHPFTAPRIDDPDRLAEDPASVLSRAYDLVLNGEELGGGSLRIFDPRMQFAVFDLLGIREKEAEAKFGFLIEALRYGCPPHGGIAFGLDRIAMMMAGASTIREVIAFPKTQTAVCPLTQAPAEVEEAQLKELHLALSMKHSAT